jgi:tRNA G46 methylase TrmB
LLAQRIMKPGGRITILTDNEWYGKYLLKLLAEMNRKRTGDERSFQLKSVAPFGKSIHNRSKRSSEKFIAR